MPPAPARTYILRSQDGAQTLDAASILGPHCHKLLAVDCAYSAIHLRESFKRPLKELGDGKAKWRFEVGEAV